MSNQTPKLAFLLRRAKYDCCHEKNMAFVEAVYEELFDELFKIAASYSFHSAEDRIQDFFVKRLLNREDFYSFPCDNDLHLKNYIFKMLRHFSCTEFKKQIRRKTDSLSEDELELNKVTVLHEADPIFFDLRKRLKRLTLRQKRAFVLFHFHGYSMEEVGEKLEASLDSVRNLLHRGKKKFLAA